MHVCISKYMCLSNALCLHFIFLFFNIRIGSFCIFGISFVFVHLCSRQIMYCQNHHFHHHPVHPCLHCHPHSYIRMVQHLIERCLLLHMDRQQCVKALARYASIQPCITLTVWRELQKENKDFFEAYFHALSPRPFMGRYIPRKPRFERKKQFY